MTSVRFVSRIAVAAASVLFVATAAFAQTTAQTSQAVRSDYMKDAQARAMAYSQVDIVRDCEKPLFDKVSADGKVVLKGMTPIEREVCFAAGRAGGAK